MGAIKAIICLTIIAVSSLSFAQRRDYANNMENRVYNLEWQLDQLKRRVEVLERNSNNPRPPVYQEREAVSCLLIDKLYSRTFYAEGRTQLEAEHAVKSACENSVVPNYCASGELKCSDGIKKPHARGAICVVTDGLYKRTHKGEGKNLVEAEAKARQTCENSVVPNYCGNKATVTCENF